MTSSQTIGGYGRHVCVLSSFVLFAPVLLYTRSPQKLTTPTSTLVHALLPSTHTYDRLHLGVVVDHAATYDAYIGRDILTMISTGVDDKTVDPRTHNVAYEARQMKKLFLRLFDG